LGVPDEAVLTEAALLANLRTQGGSASTTSSSSALSTVVPGTFAGHEGLVEENARLEDELTKLHAEAAVRDRELAAMRARAEGAQAAFLNVAALLAAFQAKERAAASSAAGAAAEATAELSKTLEKHKQEMAVQAMQAAVEGRRLDSVEYLCNRLADKVKEKPPAGRDSIYKELLDALRARSRKFKLELKERALDGCQDEGRGPERPVQAIAVSLQRALVPSLIRSMRQRMKDMPGCSIPSSVPGRRPIKSPWVDPGTGELAPYDLAEDVRLTKEHGGEIYTLLRAFVVSFSADEELRAMKRYVAQHEEAVA